MSHLRDHIKIAPISEKELDHIRAYFIAGRLRPNSYGYMNSVVGSVIVRLEIAEANAKVLQETLVEVKKQLDAARKDL